MRGFFRPDEWRSASASGIVGRLLGIAFLLTATFPATPASAMPILSLSPSATVLGFNETFTVEVIASGISLTDPLLAFGFDVSTGVGIAFNTAVVQAPFLDDSLVFGATDVAGSIFPGIAGTDILLASLEFTTGSSDGMWEVAINSSPQELGVSQGLFTTLGTLDILQSVAVRVAERAPVSLPGSLSLLLIGLMVSVLATKRKTQRGYGSELSAPLAGRPRR